MKPSYFDQDAADLDDKILRDAIDQEVVPKGCLLGGVLVKQISDKGLDPCTRCPCPDRGKCGGRPLTESFDATEIVGEARFMSNNELAARKLLRRSHIHELIRAGRAAEERKKS